MPDYSKGKIYKVINTQNEIIYIGSTIQQLSHRFCRHIHKGNGNKIILIENCPCSCKEELVRKEQEYIDQYNNLLNQMRAYNSKEYNDEYNKKYYNNNQNKLKEKKKIYYENNKERIKEQKKEYREQNKKEIKEKKKIYCKNNKDKIKERKKIYYEKIKEQLKEKVKCDLCNAEVTKKGLTEHKKRKKCINNRINCD
tara:strand:- start:143 stop:733 length:591 start_codon:yes stop_codon:yes gene_type:complete